MQHTLQTELRRFFTDFSSSGMKADLRTDCNTDTHNRMMQHKICLDSQRRTASMW